MFKARSHETVYLFPCKFTPLSSDSKSCARHYVDGSSVVYIIGRHVARVHYYTVYAEKTNGYLIRCIMYRAC